MTTERMSAERLEEIRHYVDGGMIGYPEFVAELLRELDAVREEMTKWERECLRWREKWQDEVGPIIRERDEAREECESWKHRAFSIANGDI